ncbi:inorganic phosphate transporter [Helicobacter muridarum]|uniref:Phosphate transporter n=1 Tax=Helicobacter muridarum TaxID=216 RepID=A0A099TYT3_9HELI|nr:inorganic phosphate transporter [Helicobacter muridarum]TLE00840.1 inorganic phosphate transporter [Helicobacter muridarum]STQ86604.1 phosphate permease [Helicobacter muridarum]
MDIGNIKNIENATSFGQKDLIKIGIVLLFFIAISIIAISFGYPVSNPIVLIFAVVIGGYMALNIGANDVANNVGPAVGSHAITLVGAIIIAAFAEALGAIVAGKDVVDTIKSGIIDSKSLQDSKIFICVMLAALASGAIWLNIATMIGAPVSTTHSLVGGVFGAGIMAGGFSVANWSVIGKIALSWIISPIFGGLIAITFLFIIKHLVTYKKDKKVAAKRVVPLLVFIMSWCFGVYLVQKTGILKVNFQISVLYSFVIALAIFFISRPFIIRKANAISNTKEDINELFTVPLIFSAALLSFAHGANDVANAIGPLAGIYSAIADSNDTFGGKANVPFWIMLIGGLGISLGLALYGPRLIKTVGNEITELDKMRAFCVALSAAMTVLIASQLGLPVSSTHIAIGAIFGVGFLREYLKKRYYNMQQEIIKAHTGKDEEIVNRFLAKFHSASIKQKQQMLKSLKNMQLKSDKKNAVVQDLPLLKKKERKILKKAYKNELVKRSTINRIVASWLITVPLSAVLGAIGYYLIYEIGFIK